MERVLANKANYLAQNGYEVIIITTDQRGESPFFPLHPSIRQFDLGINYDANNGKNFLNKLWHYPIKQWNHKKRLAAHLKELRADIVVCMFCNDASFIWKIKDGSKKLLEIHFSRFKRLQYARRGFWAVADKFRSWQDLRTVSRYDRFVVLTNEDKQYWGNLKNIHVIPNANSFEPTQPAALINKRAIAVGRYDYQKGFCSLIEAWKIVYGSHPDWQLDIFGDGILEEALGNQIDTAGLTNIVRLRPSVQDIQMEYLGSSIAVMSSRYEGLPMALLEGQSCGLPLVAFACKCGPKDIIKDGENGFLVPEGNVAVLAERIMRLIGDQDLRLAMGKSGRIRSVRFSEKVIMQQWIDLFNQMIKDKT
jgi:glycosyltransferase involved in cell wall biosynthesis